MNATDYLSFFANHVHILLWPQFTNEQKFETGFLNMTMGRVPKAIERQRVKTDAQWSANCIGSTDEHTKYGAEVLHNYYI